MLTILGIVATVLSAAWYLWKRKLDHVTTPEEIRAKAHEQVSKEIIRDDAAAATRRVDDWLRTLKSRQQRSGDSTGESGPAIQPKD